MREAGGDPDLLEEALAAEDGGELGMEDLDGDVAIVPESWARSTRGHAAAAQLALEA